MVNRIWEKYQSNRLGPFGDLRETGLGLNHPALPIIIPIYWRGSIARFMHKGKQANGSALGSHENALHNDNLSSYLLNNG